jgi:hypothetical protein
VIDVRTASRLIRRTFEAASVSIAKLVEHGLLQEITARSPVDPGQLITVHQARAPRLSTNERDHGHTTTTQ